jgi:hypothetical protein
METESCSLRRCGRSHSSVLVPTNSSERSSKTCLETYLKFEHIPNPINTDEDQVSRFIIIFIQKFNEYVESTGTDKHLKREGGCLVHLPHESSCFEPDFIRVLPSSKFRNDWNATNKTEVFLNLHIVQYDLIVIRSKSTDSLHSLITYRIHHFEQPQYHVLAAFDSARFENFQDWEHSMGADNKSFCIF